MALMPAFNEAQTIRAVVEGVSPLVASVVVVDDGSTDGTAERASEGGAHVIRMASNQGKGAAVRAALTHLFEGDFTHLLILDADLQHRPSEVPRLLAAAETSGADVVIGQRQFRKSEMPASRYYANRIGSWALSHFIGAPVDDTQCGFRVFRVEALRPLTFVATGYDIETEMLIKTRRRGARIVGVPVSAVYAGQPSKLRPVRDTTRTCFRAVYYRYIQQL